MENISWYIATIRHFPSCRTHKCFIVSSRIIKGGGKRYQLIRRETSEKLNTLLSVIKTVSFKVQ